jgi:hypothetical protein
MANTVYLFLSVSTKSDQAHFGSLAKQGGDPGQVGHEEGERLSATLVVLGPQHR